MLVFIAEQIPVHLRAQERVPHFFSHGNLGAGRHLVVPALGKGSAQWMGLLCLPEPGSAPAKQTLLHSGLSKLDTSSQYFNYFSKDLSLLLIFFLKGIA